MITKPVGRPITPGGPRTVRKGLKLNAPEAAMFDAAAKRLGGAKPLSNADLVVTLLKRDAERSEGGGA